MSKKKLESFKIGDSRKPRVSAPRKKSTEEAKKAAREKYTLGFSRVETILEQNSAAEVTADLSDLLHKLENFEAKAKTPKEKTAAKKAMVSVERTADLLDYLFQTKAQMQQAAGK